jgi:hypothetical protein
VSEEHRYTLRIRDEDAGLLVCDAEIYATKPAIAQLVYRIAQLAGMVSPADQATILPEDAS